MTLLWQSDYSNLYHDFVLQAKDPSRAQVIDTPRGKALELTTEPGDTDVAWSGLMERGDVYQCVPGTEDPVIQREGTESWWSHSILFPDNFAIPTWQSYVVFDFHNEDRTNTGPQIAHGANFHVTFNPASYGMLRFLGFGGVLNSDGLGRQYGADIGKVVKNKWYDFLYNVRWSSGTDGWFNAWVNKYRRLQYAGPTLYPGMGCYLKLPNYHVPIPGANGVPSVASSIVHGRVRLGTTRASVTS